MFDFHGDVVGVLKRNEDMLTNSSITCKSFIYLTSVQQTEPEYSKNLKQIYFSVLSWDTSLAYQRQEFLKEYCKGFLGGFLVGSLIGWFFGFFCFGVEKKMLWFFSI